MQKVKIIVVRHCKDKNAALDVATQIKKAFNKKHFSIFSSNLEDVQLTASAFEDVFKEQIIQTKHLDGTSHANSSQVITFLSEHKKASEAEILLLITHLNPARNFGRAFAKHFLFGQLPDIRDRHYGEWYIIDPLQRRVIEPEEVLCLLACA